MSSKIYRQGLKRPLKSYIIQFTALRFFKKIDATKDMFNLFETHGTRRPQGLGEAHADLTTLGL